MNLQNSNPIVLVVDDSPDSLGMINSALNNAGYTVLVSLNAEQALNITEQIKPDVVLMDAVMPGVDGFECCVQMRKILPLTPIIFMTGLSDVEHTVKAFKSGGTDYITKPVKPEDLLARITVHITHVKMIDHARTALDTAKQYILSVNNEADILWTTPDTHDLLKHKGLGDAVHNAQLKQAMKDWLGACNKKSDLIFHVSDKPLTIRYFKAVNSAEHLLRIVEHEAIMDASALEAALPITKREAEVMLWVAQGKTNREIAEILSLSPRTINKHLEQIYTKIQADNRTAATSIAIQALLGMPV
ncbi:MAG TPA: response regulator transcription factor [Gammaproteobacteria bacterium]|nr:response regulator transcription factor [Gammaproteobacteria bacterium]